MNNPTLLHWCVAVTQDDLLAFGKSHGWFFQVMEEKGVITDVILKKDWCYKPDSTTDPMTPGKKEAYKRLNAVIEAGYPVKQVIYGWQITEEKKSRPKVKLPDNTGEILKNTALGIGALAVGAGTLLVYGLYIALTAVDPLVAVVIDTGEPDKELPWICLSSWEK